jgi:protein-disulfide isomerase
MAKKQEQSPLMLTGMLIQIILLIVAVAFLASINEKISGGVIEVKEDTAPTPTQEDTKEPEVEETTISIDDDAVKGDPNAPVTIVEFSDFECPFCARFYTQTLPQIEEKYIETGKVKLVYRDFPLSFHQMAQKAAEAAECADDQDMFWEMHDQIYENQDSLSLENLKAWASDLGLDTDDFNDCLDTGKYEQEVKDDMAEGASYGVRGTPAFFINGKAVTGAQPYAVFEAAIEEALS